MEETANRALHQVYAQFNDNIELFAPILLGESYSNPYFISIPEKWFQIDGPRIMVVGEEGFGTYGCGKGGIPEYRHGLYDIAGIQKLNETYLKIQLGKAEGTINRSPFWRRFREVAKFGECCWSNIDKIHRLRERKCSLLSDERELLHSIPTRILHEEIKILNPTHIIFFGWYGVSLRHELPEVSAELYPRGLGDKSLWDRNVVDILHGNRHYIFSYHPNWGYRNSGYDERVIQVLCSAL